MQKYPTLEELLAANPHLDEKLVKNLQEILRKLKKERMTRKSGYGLASPFERKRASVETDDRADRRTVTLGKRG